MDLKSITKEFQLQVSSSSLQCIGGAANLLATGGYEEIISLYDVSRKEDKGLLMGSSSHQGSITCLEFYKDDYLISAADDSDIIIWRCSDWNAMHRL